MSDEQQQKYSMEPPHEGSGDDHEEGSDSDDKRKGRRKIDISFIENKSRRHITFSKRKAGIMKKAYELATLTGTQVLLLVASETGHVYTFATPKLQPLITNPEGKNLIQACLNAPDQSAPEPPKPLPPQQPSYPAPQQDDRAKAFPAAYPSPAQPAPSNGQYDNKQGYVRPKTEPPRGIEDPRMAFSGPPQAMMGNPMQGHPGMQGSPHIPGYPGMPQASYQHPQQFFPPQQQPPQQQRQGPGQGAGGQPNLASPFSSQGQPQQMGHPSQIPMGNPQMYGYGRAPLPAGFQMNYGGQMQQPHPQDGGHQDEGSDDE